MRRRSAWRNRLLAIALALAALGNVCSKPDWVAALEASVDRAVPQLEEALDKLAKDLPAAVARLDAVAAKRLRDLDATLRDAVDGLNHVLEHNRGRLDAALAARVEQVTRLAQSLAADTSAIARGFSTQNSTTVSELLLSTQLAANRLLVDLGAQVTRVEREGDRVVADVHSAADDAIVRIVGVVLVVIGLIGGALVLLLQIRRRRGVTLGIQLGLAVLVTVAGALLLLSEGVRRRFVPVAEVVVDHAICPQALARSAEYLGKYGANVTPEAVAEATEIMPAVAACLAMGGSQDLIERATARLAEIRRLLQIAPPCLSSAECPAGQTCNPTTGVCRRTCAQSRDCDASEVCHPSLAACGKPCVAACPKGAACVGGICRAAARPPIAGGRGWTGLGTCAKDTTCLQILDTQVREAIRRLP
jgi:hypothetical protein